ncbi:ketopantoate reductase family protein [Kushneria aurantia]|uniref:2-dehydropantoate 2-reductase n=1 Tax=Kushneria aurantia TaxID=504092 RepID=A0ABV6G0R6_9GAMM|nr:2-dehydropantoate 2-reductase [Kushneria aurantia]
MKTIIIGAGAMGCLFAARLSLSGNQVNLIDIDPEVLLAIRSHGIRLNMENSEKEQVYVPVHSADQLSEHFDLVLVLTKGGATEGAIKAARHLIAADTRVLTLQNGLGNADVLAKFIDPATILHGVTTLAADLEAPGVIQCKGQGDLHWWSYDGQYDPFMAKLHDTFLVAGLSSVLNPDVAEYIWEKAAFNAALNGLCTLLDKKVGEVGNQERGQRLIENIVVECGKVARHSGAMFDQKKVLKNIEHAIRYQAQHIPSMLQDRRAGHASEVILLHESIVRLSKQHDLRTPVLETLCDLLILGEPDSYRVE